MNQKLTADNQFNLQTHNELKRITGKTNKKLLSSPESVKAVLSDNVALSL